MINKESYKAYILAHVRSHLSAQARSALSIKDYCKEKELCLGTFYQWRKNYIVKVSSRQSPSFKEIKLSSFTSSVCTVQFPSGVTVHVNRGVSFNDLSSVFHLLGA